MSFRRPSSSVPTVGPAVHQSTPSIHLSSLESRDAFDPGTTTVQDKRDRRCTICRWGDVVGSTCPILLPTPTEVDVDSRTPGAYLPGVVPEKAPLPSPPLPCMAPSLHQYTIRPATPSDFGFQGGRRVSAGREGVTPLSPVPPPLTTVDQSESVRPEGPAHRHEPGFRCELRRLVFLFPGYATISPLISDWIL